MNGTSSYNGCLVGVGGNGVVNVHGGYGKGVKGGFIAMTSGGTASTVYLNGASGNDSNNGTAATRAVKTIEKAIEGLNPTTRMLLRYRYIEGLTWEEVCVRLSYSWRQTHRLHARALDQLREKEKLS